MDLGSAIMLFSTVLVTFFVVIKLIFKSQNNTGAPSSPESSSSSSFSSQHDVFPSYHREDVRSSCLNRILKEFKEKGINPFIDYETERSRSEVIKAIRGSRIAVVMLSRDYASSPQCLNELVEIIKCKNELGQKVVTIFCELDPADVTKQTGDFGEMFRETCVGKTKEETWRWGQALAEVATTFTYHSRDWDDEVAMINSLSLHISNILNISTPSSDFQCLDSAEDESNTVEEITSDVPNKKHLYTSEALEGISNKFVHTIHIYCADTLQFSFASHLSMDFQRKGLNAFVNSNDVIEEASASVVVFSKDYFSSISCLDKLVGILQYQLVVPVFYGISPSDMVAQENESADRISEWNSALEKVTELPGHHSREECGECELVEEIVTDVYDKLCPTEQIGIGCRLLKIEQLIYKQPWGIRRIGIWGMPGIGKTTLAKAVFDQISGGYDASCFIKHFDKAFHEKEHFGEVPKELPHVCSSITRPSTPQDISSKKRILVVLDDVHDPLIAESFLGGLHCFGPGSLIIITSRDKNVFLHCKVNHVYEVQSLNENESLQLFSQYAFGKCIKEENLSKLSMEVVEYANGNPLALSFYGRELKGKRLSEMETTFLKLKLRTPYKIHDLFKSSYESLDEREKNIFLDIACFFNGENVEYVKQLLEGCGLFPHVGIDVLVEKCLVTISENKVKMHRIIQDFGREIINRETVHINRRRRLWEPWTIKFLLEDNELEASEYPKATCKRALGTEDIEGIFLDTSNLFFDVKPTAFKDMLNLRFLKIYCSSYRALSLPKGLESLPYELRLLHWENYPLQSLPQVFNPCHLVELNMPNSQLHKLWEGTKDLKMLKIVKLCHSQHLTEIDNICTALNIELIDLRGCTKLRIFPATGHLQRLRVVNLSGCKEIKIFPEVSPNIEELHLEGTGIRDLKKLCLSESSSLVEVPSSIENATNLQLLDLSNCSSLVEIPFSIGNVTNLKKLCLTRCSSLLKLPSSIGDAKNLRDFNIEYCSSLVELPSSFGNATNLKILNLTGCSSLVKLSSSARNLTSLMSINLDEDKNQPVITLHDNLGSRYVEVSHTKKRKLFVLEGGRNDEHSLFVFLRIVDENGSERKFFLSFYPKDDTASKVSSDMVEQLELTDIDVTFLTELIDILLVNLIPTWKIGGLPEDCISSIFSFTSPRDACVAALVSKTFESAVKRDCVWEKFLPADYSSLIPQWLKYSSKKELYFLLDNPFLIENGEKSYWLDKVSGKWCMMLSSKQLSITWGCDPRYWQHISIPEARFETVAELVDVCWFEVFATVKTNLLSPGTRYSVYIVFKTLDSDRCAGLENLEVEVEIGLVGQESSKKFIYFVRPTDQRRKGKRRDVMKPKWMDKKIDVTKPEERKDGWMEAELGEFFNEYSCDDIELRVTETKNLHWKRGLIIQGIEFRPASSVGNTSFSSGV